MKYSLNRRSMLKTAMNSMVAAICLATSLFVASPIAAAQGYKELATQTLNQLDLAVEAHQAGHIEASQQALKGVEGNIKELSELTMKYREISSDEHDRCAKHAGELDSKIGDIKTEQESLQVKINEMEALLQGAIKDKQISQDEAARLQGEMRRLQVDLNERNRKLEELKKWWWVPGYGQYLAIRTLADNDITRSQSLAEDLRIHQFQLQHQEANINKTQAFINQLQEERRKHEATIAQLQDMAGKSHARAGEIRRNTVFLANAEVFWGKMEGVLQNKVENSRLDVEMLADLLKKDADPLLLAEFEAESMTLREALVSFAGTLDKQSGFLASSASYCGGPPLSELAINTRSTSKCNIESITAYYEIIDPKTCSFRYLNPPSCPPPAKAVQPNAAMVLASRAALPWMRSTGEQNWVAKNRCSSPNAIYYGRKDSADACEMACKSDAQCRFWTYNERNGYMPDSIQECWGATRELTPQKTDWGGFVSGGL